MCDSRNRFAGTHRSYAMVTIRLEYSLHLTSELIFFVSFLFPFWFLDWWYDTAESQCPHVWFLTASQRFPLCKFSNTNPFTLGLWACPIADIIIWWVYDYWAERLIGCSNLELELNAFLCFVLFLGDSYQSVCKIYATLTMQSPIQRSEFIQRIKRNSPCLRSTWFAILSLSSVSQNYALSLVLLSSVNSNCD